MNSGNSTTSRSESISMRKSKRSPFSKSTTPVAVPPFRQYQPRDSRTSVPSRAVDLQYCGQHGISSSEIFGGVKQFIVSGDFGATLWHWVREEEFLASRNLETHNALHLNEGE